MDKNLKYTSLPTVQALQVVHCHIEFTLPRPGKTSKMHFFRRRSRLHKEMELLMVQKVWYL